MSSARRKSDVELADEVRRELRWDPRIGGANVAPLVRAGVVTLSGRVESCAAKLAATEAARRVTGVLEVVNDVEVEMPDAARPTDAEIAATVRSTLQWHALVPAREIRSIVSDGWVTLVGEVDHWFQREEARSAIEPIRGVRGVSNDIVVRAAAVDPAEMRAGIHEAIARQSNGAATQIGVEVDAGVVRLVGTVRTWSEKKAVERAAGCAPGVSRVQGEIVVDSGA